LAELRAASWRSAGGWQFAGTRAKGRGRGRPRSQVRWAGCPGAQIPQLKGQRTDLRAALSRGEHEHSQQVSAPVVRAPALCSQVDAAANLDPAAKFAALAHRKRLSHTLQSPAEARKRPHFAPLRPAGCAHQRQAARARPCEQRPSSARCPHATERPENSGTGRGASSRLAAISRRPFRAERRGQTSLLQWPSHCRCEQRT